MPISRGDALIRFPRYPKRAAGAQRAGIMICPPSSHYVAPNTTPRGMFSKNLLQLQFWHLEPILGAIQCKFSLSYHKKQKLERHKNRQDVVCCECGASWAIITFGQIRAANGQVVTWSAHFLTAGETRNLGKQESSNQKNIKEIMQKIQQQQNIKI